LTAWLTEQEARTLGAACDRLIPPDEGFPGATAAGAVAYVDELLDAFAHEPPHIWAAGAGTATGEPTEGWLDLGPAEAHAWRTRIEGWQQVYRRGIAALGEDFLDLDGEVQDERLASDPDFRWTLYEHCCEAVYGDPAYGGNRNERGWQSIGFPGPPFPRGYTPDEVTGRA
jgi:gluconate 2-dehydrogenase gamma chain